MNLNDEDFDVDGKKYTGGSLPTPARTSGWNWCEPELFGPWYWVASDIGYENNFFFAKLRKLRYIMFSINNLYIF